jgi:hypothetical protein
MFSICTAYAAKGQLDETLTQIRKQEKVFTSEIGVIWRRFFQCSLQPHVIWAITEWETEKHHNDAAQSLMKTRRDDRIASILFGPDPYFEIFCNEATELSIGEFSDGFCYVVVAHGLVNPKAAERLFKLRTDRLAEMADRLEWLRVYENSHNSAEFVAMLGFANEAKYNEVKEMGGFRLEEYLFTGLEKPFGMSCLAGYNQFICTPLPVTGG